MKRANRLLYNSKKMGISNDSIERMKNALKVLYSSLEKDGVKVKNKEVFTKSKKLDKKQENLLMGLADSLLKDKSADIKKTLSDKTRINQIKKEQGLETDKQVIEFFDLMKRTKHDTIVSKMLDSDQVKTMYDLAREKGMTGEQVNELINNAVKDNVRSQLSNKGYVERNDQLAIDIRKMIRKFKNDSIE
jgi:hypothetical protein